MKFLLQSKDAQKRLKRSAPYFINELIKLEIAELELTRYLPDEQTLAPGAVISNPNFRVIDLRFDIPGWLAGGDAEDEDLSQFERSLTLALVKGQDPYPRIYEITPEFKQMLLSQLGVVSCGVITPEALKDMKAMGLA